MSAYVEIVFDNTDGRFPVRDTRIQLIVDWEGRSYSATDNRTEEG
jgi:hypothetical protein